MPSGTDAGSPTPSVAAAAADPRSGSGSRDVAYAALAAVAADMLRRGVTRVVFRIDDDRLPQDVAERRSLPNALVVPYVQLRCALNRFAEAVVEYGSGDIAREASARARADVWLNVAA